MKVSSYMTATSIEEAVAALAAGARPVAGGTDLVVASRQGKNSLPESLVGIHKIHGLGQITVDADGLHLGALVTHRAMVDNAEIRARYTGLADASAIVGSHATRANGTIGGNVMNASPAMDTGAPLLCHGAVAVLQGPDGIRKVDLVHLWTGPGKTSASPHELLIRIDVPTPAVGTAGSYVRLQYRRQMEIAIVGIGAVVTLDDGKVTAARIAITALAPTIHRVGEAEAALIGTDGSADAVTAATRAAAAAARPISDVRGSADYRRAMAEVIARRAIETAIRRAGGSEVAIPASESTYGS